MLTKFKEDREARKMAPPASAAGGGGASRPSGHDGRGAPRDDYRERDRDRERDRGYGDRHSSSRYE
jgi:hypothetical protein